MKIIILVFSLLVIVSIGSTETLKAESQSREVQSTTIVSQDITKPTVRNEEPQSPVVTKNSTTPSKESTPKITVSTKRPATTQSTTKSTITTKKPYTPVVPENITIPAPTETEYQKINKDSIKQVQKLINYLEQHYVFGKFFKLTAARKLIWLLKRFKVTDSISKDLVNADKSASTGSDFHNIKKDTIEQLEKLVDFVREKRVSGWLLIVIAAEKLLTLLQLHPTVEN